LIAAAARQLAPRFDNGLILASNPGLEKDYLEHDH